MGFFSGISQSLRTQAEKRKTLKELEKKTAPETLRLEKKSLETQLQGLKQKREVSKLKQDLRAEKLAPITDKLARIKTNLKSIKEKRGRSQVRQKPRSETRGGLSDAFGLRNNSPFSQNQGRGGSAFELGRGNNNPFRNEPKKPKKKQDKSITIKIN